MLLVGQIRPLQFITKECGLNPKFAIYKNAYKDFLNSIKIINATNIGTNLNYTWLDMLLCFLSVTCFCICELSSWPRICVWDVINRNYGRLKGG